MNTGFHGAGRWSRLALALALAGAAVPTLAQWQGLGPDGGPVEHLLRDPIVPGRVYAFGKGSGIFRSDDAGRHWIGMATPADAKNGIYGLSADADVPGRLYLIGLDDRLHRSDDSAQSWTATGYVFDDMLPSADPPLLVDVPQSSSGVLIAIGKYLFRSNDSGVTFAWQGMPYDTTITALAFEPGNAANLLASFNSGSFEEPHLLHSANVGGSWAVHTAVPATADAFEFLGGNRVAALLDGSVAVSSDNGSSWQPRKPMQYGARLARAPGGSTLVAMDANGCVMSDTEFLAYVPCASAEPSLSYVNALTAVADGAASRLLFATPGVGIYGATPGASWQPSNVGLQSTGIRSLAVLPSDSRVLFAGKQSFVVSVSEPRFLRSSNRGASWSESLDNLADYVRSIDIDATTAADPASVHLYAAGSSRISLTPTNSGIYKSVDGGASWTALNQGLPLSTAPGGGVRMGAARKVKADPRSCASPPASGPCRQGPLQIVYALSSGLAGEAWSVVRSNDAGANWTGVGTGLPRGFTSANAYESYWPIDLEFDAGSNAIYVCTVGNWEGGGATPYAPTRPNGVFRSDNRGATWTQRSNGLPLVAGSATTHQNVMALATHPRKGGVLWAATGGDFFASRIYKSVNGGLTWAPSGATLDGCYVRDLQVDAAAPDVIIAAGWGFDSGLGCLWRSEDGGANWVSITGQMQAGDIYEVHQDPQDHRRLLVASDRGVWEALLPSDRIFDDAGR